MRGLEVAALAVFVVNLPFGYWRAGLRKFSLPWFVAVHAPVPLVVAIRVLSGLPWRLTTVPVLVVVFMAGQMLGGGLRRQRLRPRPEKL